MHKTLASIELQAQRRRLVVVIHLDAASSHGVVLPLVVLKLTSSSNLVSLSSGLRSKTSCWAKIAPGACTRAEP